MRMPKRSRRGWSRPVTPCASRIIRAEREKPDRSLARRFFCLTSDGIGLFWTIIVLSWIKLPAAIAPGGFVFGRRCRRALAVHHSRFRSSLNLGKIIPEHFSFTFGRSRAHGWQIDLGARRRNDQRPLTATAAAPRSMTTVRRLLADARLHPSPRNRTNGEHNSSARSRYLPQVGEVTSTRT